MYNDERVSLTMIALSLIAAFWIAMASFFRSFFDGVAGALDALGNMMTSFGNFMIQTGKIVMLGSVTIGVAVVAVHMTMKLLKLVNSSTSLIENFKVEADKIFSELASRQREFERRHSFRIDLLRDQLDRAMEVPKLGPGPDESLSEPVKQDEAPSETSEICAQVANKF